MLKTPAAWLKRIPFGFVAIVLLAATTYILHKSALSGFWRFDDGAHMAFVAKYSPWQYFFNPEITKLQSGANLTPWNAFFYDVNLRLFGFNPKWFYAHQLVSLWLTSIATFFFLRLWVASSWALFGAALFLAGAPTVHIAHELMTGHYAEGLLFTIMALHAYVVAVRKQSWQWALIGALLYLLAVSCKEIYVPLVGILLFLPTGANLKVCFRFSLPFGLIALFYIFWRYQVLGRLVGGYRPDHAGYDPILIFKTFGNIPFFLFGDNALGKVALLLIAMLIAFNIWRGRLNMKLLVVGATLLLLPLVPLTLFPGIGRADRYLFLIWWGASAFIAILLATCSRNTHKHILTSSIMISLILAGAALKQHNKEQRSVLFESAMFETLYKFILNSNANQFIIPPPPSYYYNIVLNGIVEAEKAINPLSLPRARVMKDEEELESLDLARTTVWTYDGACKCVKDISAKIPGMILENQKKQLEKPLYLHVKYERNIFFWEVGPYKDGVYEVVLKDSSAIPLPGVKGSAPFNVSEKLDFYLRYNSPNGWITRSSLLHLEPASHPSLKWHRGVFVPPSDANQFSTFPKKTGGLCSIDILAGSISQTTEISGRKSAEIQGWAVLPNLEIPPEEIAVELSSSTGSIYYAILPRTSRPDVAKHFAKPDWEGAGIGFPEVDFTRVPGGSYTASILQIYQGTVWRCETTKQLTINQ